MDENIVYLKMTTTVDLKLCSKSVVCITWSVTMTNHRIQSGLSQAARSGQAFFTSSSTCKACYLFYHEMSRDTLCSFYMKLIRLKLKLCVDFASRISIEIFFKKSDLDNLRYPC